MSSGTRPAWIWAVVWIAAAFPCTAPCLQSAKPAQQSHRNIPPPGSRGPTQPGEVEDLFRQGATLIEEEKPATAVPLLRRALEFAPREGRIHHYLGYALMMDSQLPAAQKEFETALKLQPGDVYSEYFLAR